MKQPGEGGEADVALGRLAVELGLISQAQLRQVLAVGAGKRMPLGARLLTAGYLDDAGLRRLMDEQARRSDPAMAVAAAQSEADEPAFAESAAPAQDILAAAPRAKGNEEPTVLNLDADSVRAAVARLAGPLSTSSSASARAAEPAPPTPATRPAPRVIDGRFEVLDQLGRGGMGIVYRARDLTDGKTVALKMLVDQDSLESSQKRFERESRLIRDLEHPNVVRIWHYGNWEGKPYYAMEYVEGSSLGEMIEAAIESRQPLDLREVARIGHQVALALHTAHCEGIVHRDIKPDNILLTSDGVPKVADFGLAKNVTSQTKLTMSGNALGTPVYMPPEQATGELEQIDARSDIYSLGASLYEAVTLDAPFIGADAFAIMESVVNVRLQAPSARRPDIGELENVILKAMEKKKRDRYPDAESMAEDLKRYLEGEPVVARAKPADRGRRRWPVWVAVALGLAFLLGMMFAFLGKAHGDPPSPAVRKGGELAGQARGALRDADLARLLGQREGVTAQLRKAQELAQQALASDPASAEGAAVLGIAGRRLAVIGGSDKELVEAGAVLDRAVGVNPGNAELKLERGLAYWFLLVRMTRPAWPVLSDPNVPFPAITPAPQPAAETVERYRKLAAADLEEIARGDSELARAAHAFLTFLGQDADAARNAADQALAAKLYEPELRRVRGLARLDLGGVDDARDAVTDLDAYLNLSPGEASAHAERGLALHRCGKHAEAAEAFQEAEKLGAPAMEMAWNRAVCRIAAGDDARALSELAQGLKPPGDAHRWMSRATLHGRAERWEEALADLVAAARVAPANEEVMLALGGLQDGLDRSREALQTYTALIQRKPDSRRAFLARARLRETLNEIAAGIEDFTQALALGPDDPAVLLERAAYYSRRGDLDRSNVDLEQVIRLDAKNPAPLVARGRNRQRERDHAGALADFDRALALDPENAPAWMGKGTSLVATGKIEKAFEAFGDAIRWHPEETEPLLTRAQAALRQAEVSKAAPDQAKKYLTQALADLEKVVKIDPESDDAEEAKKLLRKHK